MKKITTIVSAFLFTLAIQAQEVNFKPEFKANTTYTQTVSQAMEVSVSYEGAEEPMKQEQKSTMVTTTKVGKMENNEMPFVMEIAMDKEQQGADMMNGAKFIGKVKPGSTPTFEKIDAPNLPENMQGMLKGMLEKGLSQVILPAKKLKVGDSFVHEMPLEIPLGPVTMKMKDIATYKLRKVEGRNAIFDISHVFTLEANIEGQDMKGSGTGSGEMVYDMDKSFPVKNDANVTMDMAFEMQGTKMSIKSTNSQKSSTVVTSTK